MNGRTGFSQFTSVEKRGWTYLEAGSGSLCIKEDELGEFTLRLERNVKPLRWVCRSELRLRTVSEALAKAASQLLEIEPEN
jgi:hypothetical protein